MSEDSVQKLVYGISHDMGAPLRAVTQFSQLLSQRLGEKLDEKERYWLQLIHDNGEQAQQMIDALLIYSRLTTQRPEPAEFSLQAVIDQVLVALARKIERTGAVVECRGTFPNLIGCEVHWNRYLKEVMKNALLYQPLGDANHYPEVVLSCFVRPNDGMTITIEDNGIGVPQQQWSVLTTPFKRMQSTGYQGIGMGLAYCERIVQLHGGQMWFGESSLGGVAVNARIGLAGV